MNFLDTQHVAKTTLAAMTTALLTASAHAQVFIQQYETREVDVSSGMHNNPTEDWQLAFEHAFSGGKAPWSRILFEDGNLGKQSVVIMTDSTGQQQELDSQSFEWWQEGSAIFRGGDITLQLLVAPGDEGVFIDISTHLIGDDEVFFDDTICDNTDNRAVSNDPRVGRLFFGGCTAWLASNGAVLTAGHCTDFDPDDNGPLLPDGVSDLAGVVEFNIPLSNANGTTNPADVEDQYPITNDYLQWRFDGEGQGLGKDWSVFSIGPNANTGQRAHVVQGFLRTTRERLAGGNATRITGCGGDDGNRNFVQQTSNGPYVEEESSGANIWHRYRVDTTGGTSGSPILLNNLGVAMGIHTNGGCTDTGGANSGTSFEVNALENALHNFAGGSAVEYIDRDMPNLGVNEDGRIFRPWNTIAEGVSAVPSGGTISIVRGSYNESLTISKAMTIDTPVGIVTIGR